MSVELVGRVTARRGLPKLLAIMFDCLTSLCRLRRRGTPTHRRSERGVTLVETMMASFVTAVGVAGVATLMVTTARTASVAELQSSATDLAAAEVETIRSLDYELIGLSSAADGFLPSVDGLPTVTVATDLIAPLETIELDGVPFLVERSVTWVQVGADSEAYKLVNVEVEFESSAGTRRVVVQTGVHEGLRGG